MPRYDYAAMNQLAQNDTGHFVFLSAWQYVTCLSILEQASPLYLWADDQHPLTPPEIDDLDAQLAEVQYQLMAPLVGLIMPICTDDVPPGTLLCDGTTHLRADYPNLYAKIDAAYRIDADSFMTPDLQDRFIVGSGLDHPVNETGGSATITQTIEQMPVHSHANTPHAHSEVAAVDVLINGGLEAPASAATAVPGTTGLTSVDIATSGEGQPMNITPPFVSLRYVVVAL